MLALLAAVTVFLSANGGQPAVTARVKALERIAFDDCAKVLTGAVGIDDPKAMSALGYAIEASDEEGAWVSKSLNGGRVRVGKGPKTPGCMVRYAGFDAVVLYEAMVSRLQERSFVFADGTRKPAEPQFVLDTFVRETGSVGVVSMFRLNSPDASEFAMTMYPALPENRK